MINGLSAGSGEHASLDAGGRRRMYAGRLTRRRLGFELAVSSATAEACTFRRASCRPPCRHDDTGKADRVRAGAVHQRRCGPQAMSRELFASPSRATVAFVSCPPRSSRQATSSSRHDGVNPYNLGWPKKQTRRSGGLDMHSSLGHRNVRLKPTDGPKPNPQERFVRECTGPRSVPSPKTPRSTTEASTVVEVSHSVTRSSDRPS